MTAAERALLLALFRWARADGVEFGTAYRWTRRGPVEQRWGVSYLGDDSPFLTIWRGRANARDYWVADLAEAVDLLAALGIVPARFTTAYRAGWDAAQLYSIQAHHGAQWTAIRPYAKRELAVRR